MEPDMSLSNQIIVRARLGLRPMRYRGIRFWY